MFAVKKEKCMGCKALIADKDKVKGSPLCLNCYGKEGEIYLSKLEDVNTQQESFSQLWTECQRCQGSFHQDVICSNKDCPIFYKRKKVQIDLKAVQEALDKFSW
jgi:DNA polymerase delta subunit 1